MQGVVIAGTHSGCGKTTVTLGLLAALKRKGLKVQPFKVGPDFIDAGLHRLITGRPSRNLDLWMCGDETAVECFKMYAANADISVIEGAMGLYDGETSTATLASTLGVPLVLVVDAYGMAESAGAIVGGFDSYHYTRTPSHLQPITPSSRIQGVIFNRVASDSHFKRLKESVRNVPVLGYLPRDAGFEIKHRHLGLVVAEEAPIAAADIAKLADAVIGHIDISQLLEIANRRTGDNEKLFSSPCLRVPVSPRPSDSASPRLNFRARVAVAYDRAFCFYYEDNLDLLRQAGAELIFFSPLSDPQVPAEADAVYIGGGYPELYAETLSGNTAMLASFNAWANSAKPLYAECGGLMYLSQGIRDFDGNFFKMAGVFPFQTQIPSSLKMGNGRLRARLGYREVLLKEDCLLGKKGDSARGHEFHYSDIVNNSKEHPGLQASELALSIYSVRDRSGNPLPDEGYRVKRTLASYVHLHFASNRSIADSFITHIKEK